MPPPLLHPKNEKNVKNLSTPSRLLHSLRLTGISLTAHVHPQSHDYASRGENAEKERHSLPRVGTSFEGL